MGPPTDPEAVVDSQLRYRITYFSSRLRFFLSRLFLVIQANCKDSISTFYFPL